MYIVNLEGNVTEAKTVAEVKGLLGDNKVTKKAIEAGDYPMVTLATVVEDEVAVTDDTEDKAEGITLNDVAQASPNVEIIMVNDSPKSKEVTEPNNEAVDTETVGDEVPNEEDNQEPTDTEEDEGSHLPTETLAKVNEGMEEDNQDDSMGEPIPMVDKAELASQGFVVGATVSIHDDSVNEELLTAFLDSDVDQAKILTLRSTGIVLDVAGLTETPIPASDLTVIAPPKSKADKPKKGKLVVDPDKDGYPEVGHFTVENDMKKYIKALTNEQLQEWCELEGATWNPHDNVSINRMRMAMSIKAKHFTHLASGTGTGKKKSKSKYGDYTNEQLAQMALDNDLEVPDAKGDARIERMYTIMALRKAGIIE